MKLKARITKEEYRILREWWREDAKLRLVTIHFDLDLDYETTEAEITIEKP